MTNRELAEVNEHAELDRWLLIRDALAFQLKLAVDGLRDLILLPLSAFGAFINLCGIRGTPIDFYALVRWGKWTERRINLFGAARRYRRARPDELDGVVSRVEELLVEQYQKGGITATAKDAIDRALDGIGRVSRDKQP